MEFFIVLIITCLLGAGAQEAGKEKSCFAPVVCSESNESSNEWYQVFPPRTCEKNERMSKTVVQNIIQALCPMTYHEKCFIPIVGRKVFHDEAALLCKNLDGELANIYNYSPQELSLAKFIRNNKMPNGGVITFHTGMHWDKSTTTLRLRDGSENKHVGWTHRSGDLESDNAKTYPAILEVSYDPSGSNGIYFTTTSEAHDTLCEV